jgi:glutaredoxin 3
MERMPDTNGNGNEVTVYTTEPCAFCRQAKALLDTRGIEFEEINLARSPEGREALVARTGQMTFPQILIGERAIGGFRELVMADRDGSLKALLAA